MSTRIIVADDHKIVREGIRSLLEGDADMQVVGEAENGQEAVQLARELSPDVVIMDITMPGLNGIIATHQITAGDPNIKIIALSMHSDKRFVMEMLNMGAAGYLLKDCAFEELTYAIKSVMAGGKYLSPEIARMVIDLSRDQWVESEIPGFSTLSPREYEVVKLITDGNSTKQMAAALQVSTKTVESHRRRIFKKLGVGSIAELTLWAVREGVITIER